MAQIRKRAVLFPELRPLTWPRAVLFAAVFVVAYLVLGWISHIYPMHQFNITPWNPQPALAIALLMLGGTRWLWAVFAATSLAALMFRGVPASIPLNLLIATVLTFGYFAIAHALTRLFPVAIKVESRRDMLRLTGAVAFGSLGIGIAHTAIFVASGAAPADRYIEAILRYWIGNTVGIFVTLPLLLMLLDAERRAQLRQVVLRRETLAQIAAVGVVLWVVFGQAPIDDFRRFYLLFIPLVWAATRAGVVGAVAITLIIQVGVILAVQLNDFQTLTVVELQALLLALAVTGFFLGVTVDERQRATQELKESLRLASAGEMAAALAHELNQPLTAVSTYSEVSRWLAAAPDINRAQLVQTLEKLGAEATRAADVVRRLRDFFSTGATHLQEVPLAALARNAIASLEKRAQALHVQIDLRAAEDIPPVLVDVLQIELVMRNLLENALDAVSEVAHGPKTVYIDIVHKDGHYVQLTVTDSGPGIPSEQAKNIFDAFSTTKAKGMGMGLAISRAIVEAHGGQLWARPGDRGVLSFVLPLKDTSDE